MRMRACIRVCTVVLLHRHKCIIRLLINAYRKQFPENRSERCTVPAYAFKNCPSYADGKHNQHHQEYSRVMRATTKQPRIRRMPVIHISDTPSMMLRDAALSTNVTMTPGTPRIAPLSWFASTTTAKSPPLVMSRACPFPVDCRRRQQTGLQRATGGRKGAFGALLSGRIRRPMLIPNRKLVVVLTQRINMSSCQMKNITASSEA